MANLVKNLDLGVDLTYNQGEYKNREKIGLELSMKNKVNIFQDFHYNREFKNRI